ncbi:MAG: class I SAM-dependent methyltransferase [Thermoplasmata archaeon]|nr:class I SAM-dependent methyltransferase [Thermoplasmata archaeon]
MAGNSSGDRGAVRVNRKHWEKQAAGYERHVGWFLSGPKAMAWGLWRVPESKLHFLGPVRGRDVLEIGCGAARWLVGLRSLGARPVGLDLSRRRLEQARSEMERAHLTFPLIEADAGRLPIAAGSFDLAFCDWGALTFADPRVTIPEAARVLRPGGRLVFATSSPWRVVAHDFPRDRITRTLRRDYFGLHRVDYKTEVNFVLPYGEWIRLFRDNGLTVDRLHEVQARPGAPSPYLSKAERAWGRRWPLECIWQLTKLPTAEAPRRKRRAARPRRG